MIGVSVIFFLVGMLPACVVCKLKQALRSSADNVGAAPCHQVRTGDAATGAISLTPCLEPQGEELA